MIYTFAMGHAKASENSLYRDSPNLIQTCRQIHTEATSYLDPFTHLTWTAPRNKILNRIYLPWSLLKHPKEIKTLIILVPGGGEHFRNLVMFFGRTMYMLYAYIPALDALEVVSPLGYRRTERLVTAHLSPNAADFYASNTFELSTEWQRKRSVTRLMWRFYR